MKMRRDRYLKIPHIDDNSKSRLRRVGVYDPLSKYGLIVKRKGSPKFETVFEVKKVQLY